MQIASVAGAQATHGRMQIIPNCAAAGASELDLMAPRTAAMRASMGCEADHSA